MPQVSINILTKNRAEYLKLALSSLLRQTFQDFEVILINDGSTDATDQVILEFQQLKLTVVKHEQSVGITQSRQEALLRSTGKYIALLDDDDEWIDERKLEKQVKFLDDHPEYVIVGGDIKIISNFKFQISKQILNSKRQIIKHRPLSDGQIRNTMLFRNNFFTSTVMFRRIEAVNVGGFIRDSIDVGEDYDLWLRLGKIGKMYNLPAVFTKYTQNSYNKDKFQQFIRKQYALVKQNSQNYPYGFLAKLWLKARLFL